ncbi:MAG: ATP-grasp domain-containing protein [Paludibacteraceae bacterium]|nr:ATP-grasp domain-containing protein [Paludibacteraceae bacterium]
MSKVLIIGASALQLPAILKAKEMGHFVAVADYNPDAIGIPYADQYFNASTIDVEAICKVAQEFRPDGIMTLATDMPMRSIAAATTQLGLPGISVETALKSTDKWEMIKAFVAHGVEAPRYVFLADEKDLQTHRSEISYPCIMKPTDNAGSRGVILVNNPSELDDAYCYSRSQSRSGRVIVEEYMRGKEVSVEVIVYQGVPHVLAVTDKLTTGAPYFVEMGHSQPSQLPETDLVQIRDLASRAVLAVGINNGPAHVEIMLTDKGPKMVELGARMGGDCITTHLVPLSTGIDMVKATIDIALGKEPDLRQTIHKASVVRFVAAKEGIIQSIEGEEEVLRQPNIKHLQLFKHIGDESTEIHNSLDRVACVIAQAATVSEAIEACKQGSEKLKIVIENKAE